MVFKKLSTEYAQFDLDSIGEVKSMVKTVCEQYAGPMPDLVLNKINQQSNIEGSTRKTRKNVMREQNIVICDTVRALALCHNVTPTFPDENDKKEVEY